MPFVTRDQEAALLQAHALANLVMDCFAAVAALLPDDRVEIVQKFTESLPRPTKSTVDVMLCLADIIDQAGAICRAMAEACRIPPEERPPERRVIAP